MKRANASLLLVAAVMVAVSPVAAHAWHDVPEIVEIESSPSPTHGLVCGTVHWPQYVHVCVP